MVRLEFDREQHDQYGRLLAYVFLKDGGIVLYMAGYSPDTQQGTMQFQLSHNLINKSNNIRLLVEFFIW